MRTKRYLKHHRCVTIVAIVTKLHQNDTTSCYGKQYVSDSDKRYRYDTETMEFFTGLIMIGLAILILIRIAVEKSRTINICSYPMNW